MTLTGAKGSNVNHS